MWNVLIPGFGRTGGLVNHSRFIDVRASLFRTEYGGNFGITEQGGPRKCPSLRARVAVAI